MVSRTAARRLSIMAPRLCRGQRMALVRCQAISVRRHVALLQHSLAVGVHHAAGILPPTDVRQVPVTSLPRQGPRWGVFVTPSGCLIKLFYQRVDS